MIPADFSMNTFKALSLAQAQSLKSKAQEAYATVGGDVDALDAALAFAAHDFVRKADQTRFECMIVFSRLAGVGATWPFACENPGATTPRVFVGGQGASAAMELVTEWGLEL